MAALVWLLIPLSAAVGATIWGGWAARSRTAEDLEEQDGYARFRDAMEKPPPAAEPPETTPDGGPAGARANRSRTVVPCRAAP
ncbi:hypothetical protein [Streptomyces sudanensis]|uniref:hypothetical protein n=1 Tax=Streptomyces sudanensis TaxID=436397 RepID=UPI0020CE1AB7|nr:hypothetical protein [Streptomyces sudanensis]MCQ0002062.1 hypothetical protein [Streptomyces sudanensis]